MHDVEAVVKRFKTDIHNTVGFIQDPKKLKESIKQVYVKYVSDDMVCSTCCLWLLPPVHYGTSQGFPFLTLD